MSVQTIQDYKLGLKFNLTKVLTKERAINWNMVLEWDFIRAVIK